MSRHRWRETRRVHRNSWTCSRNNNESRNSRPWVEAGSWMWTFVSFSIRSTTATFATFSSVGYGMECCWVVKQKTSDGRFSRGLKSISQWCRANRHHSLGDLHRTLCQKLRGHFADYGITGNSVALSRFRWFVTGIWRKWLSRRRRRGTIPWDQFYRLLGRYPLPPLVAIHSVYRPAASS